MNNLPRIYVWSGMFLILATGLIHLADAPDSFEEAAYKGWLFCANGVGALAAAVGIYRGRRLWGWNLGLLIAVGSMIGYTASRTTGLPLIPAEPGAWLEPLGVASLTVEVLFVALYSSLLKRSVDKRL
ncbi:MAG: hypothetical protein HZA29_05360 [Candidatus Omnitrophica bacterium]|nr:hypothetical protein [Candidatus Omnitrophota bacterium]